MEAIQQRIKEQGDLVRSLKSSKADKERITAEVATLQALKAELEILAPKDATKVTPKGPAPKTEDKKGKGGFTLKNAKVCRYGVHGNVRQGHFVILKSDDSLYFVLFFFTSPRFGLFDP